jgi:hypothetical protein
MARGNQREISRAKNQAKVDAKKKSEGKVGAVCCGPLGLGLLLSGACTHYNLSHTHTQ